MSPEERERYDRMDRQMEFLANHQALLSANLDKLRDDVERLNKVTDGLVQVTDGLVQVTVRHSERFDEVHRSLERLERITEEHGRQIEENNRYANERMNVLIGIVERYFSRGDRN